LDHPVIVLTESSRFALLSFSRRMSLETVMVTGILHFILQVKVPGMFEDGHAFRTDYTEQQSITDVVG